MRYIILFILIVYSTGFYSQKQNREGVNAEDKKPALKLDSVLSKLNSVSEKLKSQEVKTTLLEIKDADKIFKEKKEDWWEKYSSGLIALLTIALSSFVSYKIASKQSKKQEEITRQQITAQTAIAQDQIAQNRAQMQESSRITLLQVRNNNISAARIEWIQKLRPILSEFISDISFFTLLNTELDNLRKEIEENKDVEENKKKIEKILVEYETLGSKAYMNFNQIRLFLNLENIKHKQLYEKIEGFFTYSLRTPDKRTSSLLEMENKIIEASGAVLKEAWEEAKNIN